MVKDFVFIEEGSLDQYNMLKLLENSGLTNDNVIRYKQGSPKPELVSVDTTGKEIEKEDVQDIVNEAERQIKNNIFETLEEYLDNVSEKKTNDGYNIETCKFETYHVFTVFDSVQDFVAKFKKFLEEKYEK